MKPTILTPAILMAATLFGATAAHAQSASATSAWPPGPSAQAYPPGPSGQAGATAQTTNVNVVNAPTVQVGNEVTVKEPAKEPLHLQQLIDLAPNLVFLKSQPYAVPAGQRLVLENVNVNCTSLTSQRVSVALYDPTIGYAIASFEPPLVPWNAGFAGTQLYPIRLLVDDSLTLAVYRPAGIGVVNCTVTLLGYLTPLS
ncbi:MAG TPA: hypothetical protein VGQ37_15090 [Vicinamibacterales bacterium]|nr:hypothetical protein [Vicinamibacterales bacterium]